MDIEKLVERGARVIASNTAACMIDGPSNCPTQSCQCRQDARAVLALALTAAAEEADKKLAWYRQIIGNNPTNQVLAEKAQTAIDIATAIRTLAAQLGGKTDD